VISEEKAFKFKIKTLPKFIHTQIGICAKFIEKMKIQ